MKYEIGSYGWTKANRCRREVIMAMYEDDLCPTEIIIRAKRSGIRIHHSTLTRILRELEEAGIVKCTFPGLYRGRPYSLTEKGKEYRARLSKSMFYSKAENETLCEAVV